MTYGQIATAWSIFHVMISALKYMSFNHWNLLPTQVQNKNETVIISSENIFKTVIPCTSDYSGITDKHETGHDFEK